MRIIVGVSGASGVEMSLSLLRALRNANCETYLVVTEGARLTWSLETDIPIEELYNAADHVYAESDYAAVIASGSFVTDGMIVMPCSMKTLAGIANGFAEKRTGASFWCPARYLWGVFTCATCSALVSSAVRSSRPCSLSTMEQTPCSRRLTLSLAKYSCNSTSSLIISSPGEEWKKTRECMSLLCAIVKRDVESLSTSRCFITAYVLLRLRFLSVSPFSHFVSYRL